MTAGKENTRMSGTVAHLPLALFFLAGLSPACFADDNPMWKSGYGWACIQGAALICERGDICAFGPPQGQPIEILFKTSEVRIGADKYRIKRHYSQKIDGSPLTEEVKIELTGNSVIWLSPVDTGGTWSKIWAGMIIELRSGVALSVSHSLFCSPKN
jgi:hypothetical protein